MSTRETMRRELRELAKLAEAKRQEQSEDLRSSGEWSYIEPEPPFEEVTSDPPPFAEDTASPRPSRVTVPPAVRPTPAAFAANGSRSAGTLRRGSPIRVVVIASAAAILVCAAVVGRSIAGKSGSAATQSAAESMSMSMPLQAAAPIPDAPAKAALLPDLAATPALAAPAAPATLTSTDPTAAKRHTPAVAASSRPPVAAVARPAARAPAVAKANAAAGTPSLDELMRKAVKDSK